MILAELIAIFLITALFGSIFYFGLKRTGPWGTFWTFLLVLFLMVILTVIWIDPIGPVWYGAAWIDIFILGLIFALILASAKPIPPDRRNIYHKADVEKKEEQNAGTTAALGLFFWLLITVLIIGVVVGLFI